jgi:hypothetical protein
MKTLAPTLEELKDRAIEHHTSVLRHLRNAVWSAKQAGDVLRKIKKKVGHGNWLWWLEENFRPPSELTAQVYMRISRKWRLIEPHWEDDHFLTLEDALQILRKPGKPKSANFEEDTRKQLVNMIVEDLREWTVDEISCLRDQWELAHGRLRATIKKCLAVRSQDATRLLA